MGTITQTLVLNDRMSNVFTKVQQNAIQSMRAFEQLSKEADDLGDTLYKLAQMNPEIVHTKGYIEAEKGLISMTNRLDQAAAGEISLATESKNVEKALGPMDIVLGNIATKFISMAGNGVRSLMAMSDASIQTSARLNMVANSLETTGDLQEKVMQSANRSRVAYTEYANTIASLGNQASDAFANDDELLAFGETLNKMFTVSGLDSNGISSVMYNLTQSLSNGALLGQDYRILKQNAPQMIKILQDFYGVSRAELDKMVSKGQVSAEAIKAAMLNATGKIEEQFQNMPMTMNQAFTIMRNNIIDALQPLFEIISNLTRAIIENWDTIAPIATEVVIALGAIAVAWLAVTFAAKLATAAGFMALAPYLLIVAVVVFFIALLNAVAELISAITGESVSALGLLTGGIMAFGTIVMDIFLGIYNFFVSIVNGMYQAAMGWAALMVDLFGLLVQHLVATFQPLIELWDALFGDNLGERIAGFQEKVANKGAELWEEAQNGQVLDYKEFKNPAESFQKGYDFGANLFKKNEGTGFNPEDFNKDFSSVLANNGKGGKAVKTTTDDDLLSDEDIQMLLDIATRDYQLNYQQMTPNISVSFGDVRETVDVDSVLDAVGTRVEDLLNGDAEVKN